MVVCKFFQQGNCRFGQNCRFDHVYGSKFSYHANPAQEVAQTNPAVTDEQLINQVHVYVQSIIQGGQWLLSAYAPFKDKASFPGLVDMSPEEARLLIYEAKANNTLDQAVMFMNNLFKEAKQKHELLLTKNPNITKVLRSIYNGENVSDPFRNQPQTNTAFQNNASSIFRSATQPASVFASSTPSVFNQTNTFAQDPAKSIFAQATQNVFQNQTSIFNQASVPNQSQMFSQPDQAQSIFAQATQNVFAQAQPTQNVFAQAQPTQNIFTQAQPTVFISQNDSPFASAQVLPSQSPFSQQSYPATNVFQKPNQFTQNVFQQTSAVDTAVYSKIQDLSPESLEAFNSEDFKMGFIPEVPPPQSLCI